MVAFDIKGKVAIVTGGASGLGFYYALELLRKQAKVCIDLLRKLLFFFIDI